MTLLELDQFLVDPISKDTDQTLVQSKWLQQQLRELAQSQRRESIKNTEITTLRDSVALLRGKLMQAESTLPYTLLNVKA